MKYSYAYKTSDGVRHESVINAPSREAVFMALREKGIRAIKVVAADGSKANGEVRGVRKRIVAIGALCLVLGAIATSVFSFSQGTKRHIQSTWNQEPRHQIYGDPVIIEAIDHGKTESFLPDKADRMLAWFAQPGKIACSKGTDIHRLADDFAAAIQKNTTHNSSLIDSSDLREIRELKQMVNGMRKELCEYLANGNGTPRSYWRRLIQRTQQEAQIYERVKRELAAETDPVVWEQKNQALRNLGLRTIPNPKELD